MVPDHDTTARRPAEGKQSHKIMIKYIFDPTVLLTTYIQTINGAFWFPNPKHQTFTILNGMASFSISSDRGPRVLFPYLVSFPIRMLCVGHNIPLLIDVDEFTQDSTKAPTILFSDDPEELKGIANACCEQVS